MIANPITRLSANSANGAGETLKSLDGSAYSQAVIARLNAPRLGLVGTDLRQPKAPPRPSEIKSVTAEVFDDKHPLVNSWRAYKLASYHENIAEAEVENIKAYGDWLAEYLRKWEQYADGTNNFMPIAPNSGAIQASWNWIKQEYQILAKYSLVMEELPPKDEILVPFKYDESKARYETSDFSKVKKSLTTMTKIRDKIKGYKVDWHSGIGKDYENGLAWEDIRIRALEAANDILSSLGAIIEEVNGALSSAKTNVSNLEKNIFPNANSALTAAIKTYDNDLARLVNNMQGYAPSLSEYEALSDDNKIKNFPAMAKSEIVGTVLFLVAVAKENSGGANSKLNWSVEAGKQITTYEVVLDNYKKKYEEDKQLRALAEMAYMDAISQSERDAIGANIDKLKAAMEKGADQIASGALWLTQLNQKLDAALIAEKQMLSKATDSINKAIALIKKYGIEMGSSVIDAIAKIKEATQAGQATIDALSALLAASGQAIADAIKDTEFDKVNLPLVTIVHTINEETTSHNITPDAEKPTGGITLLAIIGAIAYGVSH